MRLMAESGPRLAVSLGDPAGIGPEVALKAALALGTESPRWLERLQLHANARVLERELRRLSQLMPEVTALSRLLRVTEVVDSAELGTALPDYGSEGPPGGELAYQSLMSGLRSIAAGEAAGIVTAPLSKSALYAAGHRYPGHTELLAEFAGNVPVRMMLANEDLAVVLVTIHLPLRQALAEITREQVSETIRITAAHLRAFESGPQAIAVAGLNPHAGEGGLLGREELDIIAPALADCRNEGIDVHGPHPPDTIFMRARQTRAYGAVIAQYHDQGLIPVKYLGVEHGVNITLGLPFVRTSPDHGTAFDLAGQGRADPSSMIAAIRKAAALTRKQA